MVVKLSYLIENKNKIDDAILGKSLNSRNPKISAIEVNAQAEISDMKKVKFVRAS